MVAAVNNWLEPTMNNALARGGSYRNALLGAAAISILAERIIQSTTAKPEKIGDVRYASYWLCKTVQYAVHCHFFANSFLQGVLRTFMVYGLYGILADYKFDGFIKTLSFTPFHSYTNVTLIPLIGYWADRSIKLTEKVGPVAATISLSLFALFFFNVRHDSEHLRTEIRSVKGSGVTRYKMISATEKVALTFGLANLLYELSKIVRSKITVSS